MKTRHVTQLRRIGRLLGTLADQEEVAGDLDSAETLLYLSHHVQDAADVADAVDAADVAESLQATGSF